MKPLGHLGHVKVLNCGSDCFSQPYCLIKKKPGTAFFKMLLINLVEWVLHARRVFTEIININSLQNFKTQGLLFELGQKQELGKHLKRGFTTQISGNKAL